MFRALQNSFQMAILINSHHRFKPFSRAKRCKIPSFTQAEFARCTKQAVAATNFHRSFSTPCFPLTNKLNDNPNKANTNPTVEILAGFRASRVRALVLEAAIAMASGVEPILVPSGLGGVYYLSSCNGDGLAVVKPTDEEPSAMNNPKGYVGRVLSQPGLKHSVRVGENGLREVAAYLIDHGGFAGVPPTALVKISHAKFHVNHQTGLTPLPKIASIQRFVEHDFDAGDLGMSGFSVSSVHRIGILDIRLLNLDRHAGNILVKKCQCENNGSFNGHVSESYGIGAAELVPIDHGLCLPELLDDPYFEWLHWPQAAVPFSESEAEYICQLDPLKDAELLRTELPSLRESSIRVLVLCTIFLKCAVDAGLCLAEIGGMMTRKSYGTEQGPSVLETLCLNAKAAAINTSFKGDEDEEENTVLQLDEEENTVLQFEINWEDSCCSNVIESEIRKPPKAPVKFPPVRSMSESAPRIESICDERNSWDIGYDDGGGERVIGGIMRSKSFSATKQFKHEEGISLEDMSEDEWALFLEHFEKLLPKVFEVSKAMGLKQRLGTSC